MLTPSVQWPLRALHIANTSRFCVNFTWDDEASVWIAQSDNISGLILESASLDALIERVRFATPELMEINKVAF